ncbi:MAG: transport system permease protein [Alphaproteobacteria bacterium]|jgi:iron complex transport system permease protein|nr:transport system permease protein [Alphaproteobacteria bacterium]
MIRERAPLMLLALLAVLLVSIVLAIGSGASWLSPGRVIAVLFDAVGLNIAPVELRDQAVVLGIRLPRVIQGIMVGAGLALSGALMQGLFRNPLADPGLIGISSGAALMAAAAIVMGAPVILWLALPKAVMPFVLPVAAFAGGLVATLLIHQLARRDGETEIATMLLAGVAVAAICMAGIGYLSFLSDDRQLRDITFWTLGSLGGSSWRSVLATAIFLLPVLAAAPLLANTLNALILGEREAGHLGINVERHKKLIIAVSALAVGASVAASGIIGFVGLVVPHLARLMLGADHRYVLPGAALLGAALMLVCDLVARVVVAPAELPIGVVMSALGGPFFLWMLRQRRALTMS